MSQRSGHGQEQHRGQSIVTRPPVWREEDGQLLQTLRQNAKIDNLVFARNNAISVAQLRELEGHGDGNFYNAQIKLNTGHKLLKKLGHEPVFEISAPALTTSLITAPDVKPTTPAVPLLTTHQGIDHPQATNVRTPAHRTIIVPPKWAGVMLLLGGLAWSVSRMPWSDYSPSLGLGQATAPDSVELHSATQEPMHAYAAALGAATHAPTPNLPVSAPATGIAPADDHPTAACDWRHRQSSANYESADPIKAGNYIHFVASQDVSLCVRDHQNRLTDLRLKAGSAQSVYGAPPFLVHSASWPSLQIFYQGRRVIGAPDGANYWVFKNKDL